MILRHNLEMNVELPSAAKNRRNREATSRGEAPFIPVGTSDAQASEKGFAIRSLKNIYIDASKKVTLREAN